MEGRYEGREGIGRGGWQPIPSDVRARYRPDRCMLVWLRYCFCLVAFFYEEIFIIYIMYSSTAVLETRKHKGGTVGVGDSTEEGRNEKQSRSDIVFISGILT